MEWVLILWINFTSKASIDHIEFKTQAACEYAGEQFKEKAGNFSADYLCTPAEKKGV